MDMDIDIDIDTDIEENMAVNRRNQSENDFFSNDELKIIKSKIAILNKFRYLYYCLRWKKKFTKWLWKIREPQIQQKYHPRYLLEHLTEDDELEEFLEKW